MGKIDLARAIPAETAPFGRKWLECMENRCAAKKALNARERRNNQRLSKSCKEKTRLSPGLLMKRNNNAQAEFFECYFPKAFTRALRRETFREAVFL